MNALGHHALEYTGYLAELALLVALVRRHKWSRDVVLALYAIGFILLDGAARLYTLYHYGAQSKQYFYCYWITDVLLTLGAFLLICAFFRWAYADKKEIWSFVRTMLGAVFTGILVVSYLSLSAHYDHLFGRFIIELQQNLYFACLILNTVLFLLLQQRQSEDSELSLLVCGLGIEFAGAAAALALAYLTPGGHDAGVLAPYVFQFCNIGMFLTWLYAVTRKEELALAGSQRRNAKKVPGFAETSAEAKEVQYV